MLKQSRVYIDLGTHQTTIYSSHGGMRSQPSCLALKSGVNQVERCVATGRAAESMSGRAPDKIRILRPLKEGVIADYGLSLQMLASFLGPSIGGWLQRKPRLLISLPKEVSHHERQSVYNLGIEVGAGQVDLVEEPLLAALGESVPVFSNQGHMVVDLGGGTAEAVIYFQGRAVVSGAVRVGGQSLTQGIIQQLRLQEYFLIGEQSAEKVKFEVASVSHQSLRQTQVVGMDLRSGQPEKRILVEEMLQASVDSYMAEVWKMMASVLERCPPELAADLCQTGITLVGGSSLLHGLAERVGQLSGLPVFHRGCQESSAARGGARLLQDAELYDQVMSVS